MEYCIQKNNEAYYFYKRLKELEKKGNLVEFTYNLSEFLTASRSITSYIRNKKENKKNWRGIENLTNIDKKIKFLKDQRNITVHISKLK